MKMYETRGRCDRCMKENTEITVTLSPDNIQGQVCNKCMRGLD